MLFAVKLKQNRFRGLNCINCQCIHEMFDGMSLDKVTKCSSATREGISYCSMQHIIGLKYLLLIFALINCYLLTFLNNLLVPLSRDPLTR
jgi:hypothetical protein